MNHIRAAIDKDLFPNLFAKARQQSFTYHNITTGFRKTGIFPCNPQERLEELRQPNPLPSYQAGSPHTPQITPPSSP